MKYDYDYEFAFYANRPAYLYKGQKNPCNYRFTGCFNTGDYWTMDADNKEQIEAALRTINRNETVIQNTIALQNKFGQLVWTREGGFTEGTWHPAYMDRLPALQVNNW